MPKLFFDTSVITHYSQKENHTLPPPIAEKEAISVKNKNKTPHNNPEMFYLVSQRILTFM